MQKKSIFVIFNKYTALLWGAIVLILSIFTANHLKNPPNSAVETDTKDRSYIYKQLENYAEYDKQALSEAPKMNNSISENANNQSVEVFSSSDRPTSDNFLITVLDTENGVCRSMPLEEYTLCVLLGEMPQNFHSEALMAQAVAIRSFTLKSKADGTKHKNADVCTDYRCCQSFVDAGRADFDISKARQAVSATRGIIAVYESEPILAAYHSSSAVRTKSSKEVWGGELDYLVSVASVEGTYGARKESVYSSSRLDALFAASGFYGKVSFIHGSDGFCLGANIGGSSVSPELLRRILSLRSDTITVSQNGNDYVFTCYGFGHGVGLSQYGADALAKDGYSFYEILKHYYTGISFGFLE